MYIVAVLNNLTYIFDFYNGAFWKYTKVKLEAKTTRWNGIYKKNIIYSIHISYQYNF